MWTSSTAMTKEQAVEIAGVSGVAARSVKRGIGKMRSNDALSRGSITELTERRLRCGTPSITKKTERVSGGARMPGGRSTEKRCLHRDERQTTG